MEISQMELFSCAHAHIVEYVSEYTFFVLNKKTHTHKQKDKETKECSKTKETKEEKEKENVVVVNSICGKSVRI